jgi:hypothetical protein
MTATPPRQVGELDKALLEDLHRRARARRRRRNRRPVTLLVLAALVGIGLAVGLRERRDDPGTVIATADTTPSSAPAVDSTTHVSTDTSDTSAPPTAVPSSEPIELVAVTPDGFTASLRIVTEHVLLDRFAERHQAMEDAGLDTTRLPSCAPDTVGILEMANAGGDPEHTFSADDPMQFPVRNLGDDVALQVRYGPTNDGAMAYLVVRTAPDSVLEVPHPTLVARADGDGWHLLVLSLAPGEAVLQELATTVSRPDAPPSPFEVTTGPREGDAPC